MVAASTVLFALIYLFAITNFYDEDDQSLILDLVDYAMISNSNPVKVVLAFQLFDPAWTRRTS